jgi:hypothetical protein
MSMIFCPAGWELAVDNPGYGALNIRALTDPYDAKPLVKEEWSRDFYGPKLGQFLNAVTAIALGGTPGKVGFEDLPAFITATVARDLLPALQHATLLALAGTDRFERTFPDTEERPAKPLCVRCNLGSDYTATPTTSEWCEQHGHRAFGTAGERWEHAQELHELAVQSWQRAQDRQREDQRFAAETAAARTGQLVNLDAARRDRRRPQA